MEPSKERSLPAVVQSNVQGFVLEGQGCKFCGAKFAVFLYANEAILTTVLSDYVNRSFQPCNIPSFLCGGYTEVDLIIFLNTNVRIIYRTQFT
jgi:hypothetical protein